MAPGMTPEKVRKVSIFVAAVVLCASAAAYFPLSARGDRLAWQQVRADAKFIEAAFPGDDALEQEPCTGDSDSSGYLGYRRYLDGETQAQASLRLKSLALRNGWDVRSGDSLEVASRRIRGRRVSIRLPRPDDLSSGELLIEVDMHPRGCLEALILGG